MCPKIEADFEPFGLQIVNFYVENISLPPEVEAAIDKRSSMGAIGNLSAFTQYQAASALPAAAANSGGLGNAGAGLAMGMAMGNAMSQGLAGQPGAERSARRSPAAAEAGKLLCRRQQSAGRAV